MAFGLAKKTRLKLAYLAIATGLIIHVWVPSGHLTDFFMGATLSFGSIVILMTLWQKSRNQEAA